MFAKAFLMPDKEIIAPAMPVGEEVSKTAFDKITVSGLCAEEAGSGIVKGQQLAFLNFTIDFFTTGSAGVSGVEGPGGMFF